MTTQLNKMNKTNTLKNNLIKSESAEKQGKREKYRDKILLKIFVLISTIKLILFPTYHSTDFEVHRNWLAITHSLPIKEWYENSTSQWTLDYPPLFAWFEYLLSQFGRFFDPEMLKVENLNYASSSTKLFQRSTVVIADIILLFGVREISKVFHRTINSATAFFFLSLCNIGLLMVDHIHFQYNGFLLGILLLSISQVSKNDPVSNLKGAALFAILLNLKHLYLYVAPAFTIWLLIWFCMRENFFTRFIQLGAIVISVLAVSFGPFVFQLPQIFSRLFPFNRGLVHAYWAPNAWALYIGADKIASIIWKKLGWLSLIKKASMTGGLVQEDNLIVLPTPTPHATFIATMFTALPIIIALSTKPKLKSLDFLRCLVLCALNSFMFGWHVHEKAILTAIIPLCILATIDFLDARIFLILSAAGHTGILPLLYPDNLTLLKILLLVLYIVAADLCLCKLFNTSLLKTYEWIYIAFLPLVSLNESVFHKIIFGERLPFLPLAIVSIYCAIGVTYCWALYYWMFIIDSFGMSKEIQKKK